MSGSFLLYSLVDLDRTTLAFRVAKHIIRRGDKGSPGRVLVEQYPSNTDNDLLFWAWRV
jgi:hypothetical protein